MLTPEMLDDAQQAFAAGLTGGLDPAQALKDALEAALAHCAPTALKNALANERSRRKYDAHVIRHTLFSLRPKSAEVQELISYLARWHTSFSLSRLSRITGYGTSAMAVEIRTWMAANPGRLDFDEYSQLFRTPRAARRAAQVEHLRANEEQPA